MRNEVISLKKEIIIVTSFVLYTYFHSVIEVKNVIKLNIKSHVLNAIN